MNKGDQWGSYCERPLHYNVTYMVIVTFSVIFELLFPKSLQMCFMYSVYQKYVSYTKMLGTINHDKFPKYNYQRRLLKMMQTSEMGF